MKKTVFCIVTSAFLMIACKKTEELIPLKNQTMPNQQMEMAKSYPSTTISIDKLAHDFGDVKQGDVLETTFRITNTGKEDLYIIDAVGSCGCTVPLFDKNAIKPNATTNINVKFDTKNKTGINEKSVRITCNTEAGLEVVKVRANIK
jgi:Protein of unknown function (DUF1573)